MTPLNPDELSAYLDGELSAERMREVESLLASDPILRAEFETLAAADSDWRSSARSAKFYPRLDLPLEREDGISVRIVLAFVVALIIMQFALRQFNVFALTLALNGVAFAVVLLGVVLAARSTNLSGAEIRELKV